MRLTTAFDLGGLCLEVSAEGDALLEQFRHAFAGLAADPAGPPSFRLHLGHGEPPVPAAAAVLAYEGPVEPEGFCRLFHGGGETLLVFPDLGSLQVRHDARAATLRVCGGAMIGASLGIAALAAAAHAGDQSLLHAAALTPPGRDDMVLIHAPSGAGKTTTALALLAGGYGLASDDAAFLGWRPGCTAYGLPRDLKVHHRSAAMLPWTKDLLVGEWNAEGERRLPRARLAGVARLEAPRPRPVAGLFRLVRGDGASTVAPLGQAEMLASLAADNVRTGRQGLLPIDRHRLAQLARLVREVPLYELRVGGDLDRLPELVSRCLAPA